MTPSIDLLEPALASPRFRRDQRYRLSHYCQIRPEPGRFVAESLLTGQILELKSQTALRLLLAWAEPTRADELLAAQSPEQQAAALGFFARCHGAGLLTEIDDGGRAAETALPGLGAWELHDLAYHVRSRRGRNPFPVGGTYHRAAELPLLPALRPADPERPQVPLEAPVPTAPPAGSLDALLDGRRSRYSTAPVPFASLARLLVRSARVTEVRPTRDGDTLLRRPYPSGGGVHALDLYLVALRVAGLEPGAYRYLPDTHSLEPHGPLDEDRLALLEEARVGTGTLEELPSALLVFGARMGRVSRKYQSIAYHLLLVEAGALLQTLYLVAESEGLAACAIGAGDADRFARTFGTSYYEETSLAEMILGGGEGAR
jgi:oxazoline/thiazoline dehydrogenase